MSVNTYSKDLEQCDRLAYITKNQEKSCSTRFFRNIGVRLKRIACFFTEFKVVTSKSLVKRMIVLFNIHSKEFDQNKPSNISIKQADLIFAKLYSCIQDAKLKKNYENAKKKYEEERQKFYHQDSQDKEDPASNSDKNDSLEISIPLPAISQQRISTNPSLQTGLSGLQNQPMDIPTSVAASAITQKPLLKNDFDLWQEENEKPMTRTDEQLQEHFQKLLDAKKTLTSDQQEIYPIMKLSFISSLNSAQALLLCFFFPSESDYIRKNNEELHSKRNFADDSAECTLEELEMLIDAGVENYDNVTLSQLFAQLLKQDGADTVKVKLAGLVSLAQLEMLAKDFPLEQGFFIKIYESRFSPPSTSVGRPSIKDASWDETLDEKQNWNPSEVATKLEIFAKEKSVAGITPEQYFAVMKVLAGHDNLQAVFFERVEAENKATFKNILGHFFENNGLSFLNDGLLLNLYKESQKLDQVLWMEFLNRVNLSVLIPQLSFNEAGELLATSLPIQKKKEVLRSMQIDTPLAAISVFQILSHCNQGLEIENSLARYEIEKISEPLNSMSPKELKEFVFDLNDEKRRAAVLFITYIDINFPTNVLEKFFKSSFNTEDIIVVLESFKLSENQLKALATSLWWRTISKAEQDHLASLPRSNHFNANLDALKNIKTVNATAIVHWFEKGGVKDDFDYKLITKLDAYTLPLEVIENFPTEPEAISWDVLCYMFKRARINPPTLQKILKEVLTAKKEKLSELSGQNAIVVFQLLTDPVLSSELVNFLYNIGANNFEHLLEDDLIRPVLLNFGQFHLGNWFGQYKSILTPELRKKLIAENNMVESILKFIK